MNERIQPPPGRRFVKGYGPKNARVMFVGEAPGYEEDREGIPFVGKTGRELKRYCDQVGINLAQCYRTNVVKYRPEYRGAGAGNNAPTAEDIARDEHILIEEIETVRPEFIAGLGRTAIRWLLGDVDVEDVHGLPHWTCNSRAGRGKSAADIATVAHFCLIPMYHPAAGLHSSEQQPVIFWDFQQLGAYVSGQRLPLPVVNQYPNPDYALQPWITKEERNAVRGRKIAVDTEGLQGRAWGLSYSHTPGWARVVLNEYGWAKKDVMEMMRHNRTILHNSPHDIPILAEMFGITVEELLLILTWEGGFDDTMVKSYVLRLLPQGLKALELRLAGMISPSYMDVVRDADREIVVEYLQRLLKNKCHHCEGSGDTVEEPVSAKTGKVLAPRLVKCPHCEGDGTAWPPPPEQLVYEKGKVRISRGWPIGRRVRGILKDIDKIDPETGHHVNLRKRWESIDEEYRQVIEDVAGPMREVSLSDVKPPEKAIDYSAQDADATLRVDDVLDPMLDEFGVREVYEIDRNAIPLIVQMMTVGTLIDRPYFAKLSQRLENECDRLLYKLEQVAGHYVNPASSMQVSELLFEKFALDPIKETKSGGAYSTDDKVLEDLKLQVAARDDRRSGEVLKVLTYITDYRERHKLRSTYTESLPRKADKYDRIHTTFKITRTESGRFSSADPNLQNIPARSDLGKLVRAGFVPKPGCVLLACDFGQIEMRVLAHESGDDALIAAIRGGLDVHNLTTNKIFGIPIDKAKGTWQRTASKTLGFGIVYGISAPALKAQIKLAGGMDVSEEQCQAWIDFYLEEAFPGIGIYMESQKAYARRYGYVQDMFGRRRYLPGAMSEIRGVRSEAERVSVNHPIQAGAGGIMKLACPEIMWDVLPKVRSDRGYYCEPLLTVHDEFVFEVAEERAEYLEKVLVPVMVNQVKLQVPMEADAKIGLRWSECK